MKRCLWVVLFLFFLSPIAAFSDISIDDFENYQSWSDMEAGGWHNWGQDYAEGSVVVGAGFEGGSAFKSKSLVDRGGSANYSLTFAPQDWSGYDYLSMKVFNPEVNYTVGQHINLMVRDSNWAVIAQTGWNYNVCGQGDWLEFRIYIDGSSSWTSIKGLEIQAQQYYLGDELIFDDIVLMPRKNTVFEGFSNYADWAAMKSAGWYNWGEQNATGSVTMTEGVNGGPAFKSTSLISQGGSANYTFNFGQTDWSNYESVSVKVLNTGINALVGQHVNFQIMNSDWGLIAQTDWQWNVANDGDWDELVIPIDGGSAWQDAAVLQFKTNQYYLGDELVFDEISLLPMRSLIRIVPVDTALRLNENGGSCSYDVYLVTEPSSEVLISVESSSSSVDLGSGVGNPIMLEFTPSNYYRPQRITLTGVDNSDMTGATQASITHTVLSDDVQYAAVNIEDVVVDVIDDDMPTRKLIEGFETYSDTYDMSSSWVAINNADTVSRTLVAGDPNVYSGNKALKWEMQAGQSSDWWVWSELEFDSVQDWRVFNEGTLKFNYKATNVNPSSPVKLGLYIYNSAGTLVYPFETLITVTEEWQECQIYIPQNNWTGLGLDGYADIKKIRLGVCHQGWLETTFYVDDIRLSKEGVFLTETNGKTSVSENNETVDSYRLELASAPTSDVVVDVSTDGQTLVSAGDGFAQNIEFTLTPADWVNGRRIFVKAVDDSVLEGDHVSIVSHVAQSVDPQYDGYVFGDLTVSVTDNECGAWGYADADLNKDCVVDIKDFASVAKDWQEDNFTPGSETMLLDFEAYATQAEMESDWSYYYNQTGQSTLALLTDPTKAHTGNNALQWDYDLTGLPINGGMSEVIYELDSPVNLSEYDQMNIWMNRRGENSEEYILYVKFLDGDGNTNANISGEKWITLEEGSTYSDPNEWVEWQIGLDDLYYESSTGVANGYDELSDITDVRALVFGTYSGTIGGDMGAGTIYFDDLQFSVLPVCTLPLEGDVNGDCKVNMTDFNITIEQWLDCTEPYFGNCIKLN